MKCPLCTGSGEIKSHQKRSLEWKTKKAQQLRKLGFTYREITQALGYKSYRSIQQCLEREINK